MEHPVHLYKQQFYGLVNPDEIPKGHFTKVYSNKGGQPQNFSGILSAVYILYVVIKGMNKFLQF